MKKIKNSIVPIQNNMQKGESITFIGKEGIDKRNIPFEKKIYENGVSTKKEELKDYTRYTVKVPKN